MSDLREEHTLSRPKILVCIPAYNEAAGIARIVESAANYSSEVLVYDDGSSDNTAELAKAAGATVIRSRKNKGYGAAIRRLFEAAAERNVDIMVTLDSDGQHNPEDIPKVCEPILKDGFDIVVGSRFLGNKSQKQQQKIPAYRSLGIKTITRFTQSASYSQLTDAQSGFRAYSKKALSGINLFEEGMAVSTEILLRAGEKNLNMKEVPVLVNYDIKERSSQNPISHGIGVLYSVVQFISLRHPLSFYGLPGIGLLAAAIFFLNVALKVYAVSRPSSLEDIVISVGFGVVGVVLLATGAILYTITALLRGRIKDF
jgi:glycosyltransferase involved in cell wall biosynthesis